MLRFWRVVVTHLRTAGEQLRRRHGEEAAALLNATLEQANEEIERVFSPQIQPEGE